MRLGGPSRGSRTVLEISPALVRNRRAGRKSMCGVARLIDGHELRSMARIGFLLVLLPMVLGGCTGTTSLPFARADESASDRFPADYKAETLAFLRTYLNEPTKIRDAYISEPALKEISGQTRYVSCLRYNARRNASEYAGSKDRLAVFRAGRFDRFNENGKEVCADAAYARFPELEQLTR